MRNISGDAFYEELLTSTQGESLEHAAASICFWPLSLGKTGEHWVSTL